MGKCIYAPFTFPLISLFGILPSSLTCQATYVGISQQQILILQNVNRLILLKSNPWFFLPLYFEVICRTRICTLHGISLNPQNNRLS